MKEFGAILLALGLVLVLAAVGINAEVAGTKVPRLRTRKLRRTAGGLGLLAVAAAAAMFLWPHSKHPLPPLRISKITVSPQADSFARPCPKKIPALVELYGSGRSGEVRYIVNFDQQRSELHLIHMSGTEKSDLPHVTRPSRAQGVHTLHAEVIFPEPRRFAEREVSFNC